MARPDPPDEQTTARLSALELPARPRTWAAEPGPEPASGSSDGRVEPPRATSTGVTPPTWRDLLPPWAADLTAAAGTRALLALSAVCAGCIAVTAYVVLHGRAAGPAPAPLTTVPAAVAPSASSAAELVVDVGGRVRRPGLVSLPAGARVADAIRAAGGPLRHRDVARLNLAARVADGQLLLVGVPGFAGVDTGDSSAPGRVNLNSATVEQLDTLPGIGPVLAQRIIDWRTAHGGFRSVDDLDDVSGIGAATFADLQPLVSV